MECCGNCINYRKRRSDCILTDEDTTPDTPACYWYEGRHEHGEKKKNEPEQKTDDSR